jgi:hypothetical protein
MTMFPMIDEQIRDREIIADAVGPHGEQDVDRCWCDECTKNRQLGDTLGLGLGF